MVIQSIAGRYEEEGGDFVVGIVGRVTFAYSLLRFIGQVCLHVAVGGVAHVVDKYTEAPYSQTVQVVKFGHEGVDTLVHGCYVGETDGLLQPGVSGPDEIDVAGFGGSGHGAQVVLGYHAEEALLLGERSGVVVAPVAQVVGVRLGTVDEYVHFESLAEF